MTENIKINSENLDFAFENDVKNLIEKIKVQSRSTDEKKIIEIQKQKKVSSEEILSVFEILKDRKVDNNIKKLSYILKKIETENHILSNFLKNNNNLEILAKTPKGIKIVSIILNNINKIENAQTIINNLEGEEGKLTNFLKKIIKNEIFFKDNDIKTDINNIFTTIAESTNDNIKNKIIKHTLSKKNLLPLIENNTLNKAFIINIFNMFNNDSKEIDILMKISNEIYKQKNSLSDMSNIGKIDNLNQASSLQEISNINFQDGEEINRVDYNSTPSLLVGELEEERKIIEKPIFNFKYNEENNYIIGSSILMEELTPSMNTAIQKEFKQFEMANNELSAKLLQPSENQKQWDKI